jgi:hypothetical protein
LNSREEDRSDSKTGKDSKDSSDSDADMQAEKVRKRKATVMENAAGRSAKMNSFFKPVPKAAAPPASFSSSSSSWSSLSSATGKPAAVAPASAAKPAKRHKVRHGDAFDDGSDIQLSTAMPAFSL